MKNAIYSFYNMGTLRNDSKEYRNQYRVKSFSYQNNRKTEENSERILTWEEKEKERSSERFSTESPPEGELCNEEVTSFDDEFNRGCFGCCTKSPLITVVDEPSKGLKVQGRKVKKSTISEDFWSSSSREMDNSALHSQRSVSSISFSNQPLDPSSSTSSTSEFVNHGLLLWNQTRQEWLANKRSQKQIAVQEPSISWNATYESLLGSNKPFPRPIPLAEMVDFLVDVWEQEGLYD